MITEIALKDLTISPLNVRKISTPKAVEDLAQSILSQGLFQNLNAFKSKDGEGFEVVAGGQRLLAMQLIAKNNNLDPSTYMVRVNVVNEADATDISLAENAMRTNLHAADQFAAFKKLVDGGKSVEDVAANYCVPTSVVKQRLRMASAAPEVIAAFKAGDLEIDQVMALCTTDNPKIQKALLKSRWMGSEQIRKSIEQEIKGVDADDRLVKFIGLAAYTEAGGKTIEDLFAAEFGDGSGTVLTDAGLVTRLATEKLEELASAAQAKQKLGWSKVFIDRSYFIWSEQKVEKITGKPTNDDKKSLGIIYYIDRNGNAQCEKNLINYGDRKKLAKGEKNEDSSKAAAPTVLLSADATSKITQVRTKALQCAIASDPDKALRMLVCHMITNTYDGKTNVCFGLRISPTLIFTEIDTLESLQDQQFKGCGLADLLDDGSPKDDMEELVDALKTPQLVDILAFLTSAMVDVTQGGYSLDTFPHRMFTELGQKFNLNMADHFKPDQENYFGHMPKAALVEFLADTNLANKKKGLLAALASDRVAANWEKGIKFTPEILHIEQDNKLNQVTWPFPSPARN